MGIGGNIKKFRRGKRWTQANLAEATGLSRGYIAAIEQENRHPRTKTLAIIAAKLGVWIDDLRKGEED